jgi:hypothetical protein
MGPVLPLGIPDKSGLYSKTVAVRPWRMKEERELGEMKDKNRDGNLAQYVSMVLATMCTKIGPYDFEVMKPEERRVVIGQMFMCDVFYAYVYLRIQAMGKGLPLKLTCPRCQTKYSMEADLNTTEVKFTDTLENARWQYKLIDPFQVRSKDASELVMGPPRWNVLEMLKVKANTLNTSLAKVSAIMGSIHSIVGIGELAMTENELDEMSKRDIEAITSQINDFSLGPDMVVESEPCPSCNHVFKVPIEWGYDSFFANSTP